MDLYLFSICKLPRRSKLHIKCFKQSFITLLIDIDSIYIYIWDHRTLFYSIRLIHIYSWKTMPRGDVGFTIPVCNHRRLNIVVYIIIIRCIWKFTWFKKKTIVWFKLVLGRLLNYFYFNGDKIKSKNFFLIVIIVIIVIIVLHFFTIHINVLFYMFYIL